MSAQPGSNLKPGLRPSTPAATTPASQGATPRSHPMSGAANSPSHARTPSGARLGDSRSPNPQNAGAPAMQRDGSSKPMSMLSPPGGPPQMQRFASGRSMGTPRMATAGKTVPAMSSAGKTLPIGNAASRPDTPGGISGLSPAVSRTSPGLSSLGGTGSLGGLPGFDSPALAGLTGPMDMSLSLSNLSNLPLGASLSNLGSTGGGKIDDEERRRRLESVLDIVRMRPGRISREALERLGRRCEMDIMLEGEDKLSLAGKNAVLIDLQYQPNRSSRVDRVSVHFPTASDELSAHSEKASKILHKDLSPSEGTAAINATLAKFADNLERLARMDKLSLEDTKTNCFEAVFRVYRSLRRLYEQEKAAAQKLMSSDARSSKANVDIEVMCKSSGRPRLHARRRVGLSLEYWSHRRHLYGNQASVAHDENAMDVGHDAKQDESNGEEEIHSLIVECEHCPPALYQPIRTPESWLSDRILKPPEEVEGDMIKNGQSTPPLVATIEWLEPPSAFQPLMGGDGAPLRPRPPHARFVAYLEPPVTLPAQVAAQLYASVDVDINAINEPLTIAPFTTLVLPQTNTSQPQPQHGFRHQCFTTTRPILIRSASASASTSTTAQINGPTETDADYTLTLTPSPSTSTDPAVHIFKLPFSHPRQLVALLPTLRQYAFLARVLQNSFFTSLEASGPKSNKAHKDSTSPTSAEATFDTETVDADTDTDADVSAEDTAALYAFLAAPTAIPNTIDATLALSHGMAASQPHMDVAFATEAGPRRVRLLFCENGRVEVGGCDGFGGEGGAGVGKRAQAGMARALEVAEDLGLWVAWIRERVAAGEFEGGGEEGGGGSEKGVGGGADGKQDGGEAGNGEANDGEADGEADGDKGGEGKAVNSEDGVKAEDIGGDGSQKDAGGGEDDDGSGGDGEGLGDAMEAVPEGATGKTGAESDEEMDE